MPSRTNQVSTNFHSAARRLQFSRAKSFKQTTEGGIRLEVNQIARVDLAMQLGAVSESVEVRAAAPLLRSNSSAVGQVVESRAVSDLPLNGHNFAQLADPQSGAIGVGLMAGPSGADLVPTTRGPVPS